VELEAVRHLELAGFDVEEARAVRARDLGSAARLGDEGAVGVGEDGVVQEADVAGVRPLRVLTPGP